MSRTARGYLIALVGIVIWSTAGIFIGYLLTTYRLPALVLAFWRNLLVCVVLLPALALLNPALLRVEVGQLRYFALYGFILAVFNSIWALSVQSNGAAVATVLAYSSAGFTAILAFGLFNEKLGPAKIAAIVLSLAGCVLVSRAYSPAMWTFNPLGLATGLGSGILFAAYTLMGKETARRSLSPWTAMLYAFGFGSVFVLCFNVIPGLPGAAGPTTALWPQLPLDGWLILAFLSAGPTLLGFGLYNASMRFLPASIVNLLATTEPALTAVEAYLFLNERLSPVQIVGGLIILSAVVIVQLERD